MLGFFLSAVSGGDCSFFFYVEHSTSNAKFINLIPSENIYTSQLSQAVFLHACFPPGLQLPAFSALPHLSRVWHHLHLFCIKILLTNKQNLG